MRGWDWLLAAVIIVIALGLLGIATVVGATKLHRRGPS